VSENFYEGGGKIPSKSTPMKHLVLAWYAQYWVGAGWKEFMGDL
jgi:hypothetical protein